MHRKRFTFALVAVIVVMLGAFALAPTAADAALSVPVKAKQFAGTLTITGFVVDTATNQVAAVGTLSGTGQGPNGIPGTVVTKVVLPVLFGTATCDVLHLTLGPLDLDLLGLVVHLDQVNLTIDAVAGAGNLLGNLLCAIANLLNGSPLDLNGLVLLLNQLLALL